MEEFDVIVIGASVAGLRSAHQLAKRGLKVLCLDKKQEVGNPKQCGEGLGLGHFNRLGIKPQKEWAVAPMRGAMLYAPSGKEVDIKFDKIVGYVLERRGFEKYLARKAAKAGAKIRFRSKVVNLERVNGGVKVTVKDLFEGEYFAKLIFACDGPTSVIANRLGLPISIKAEDLDSGIQYEMTGIDFEKEDRIHLWFGSEIAPRGYCLTPDTEVFAKNTVKPITELSVGEEVLTLDGWMPISGVSERDYAGEVVEVIPAMLNSKVKLTAEHLVYAWNMKNGFEWKKAGDLVKGKRGEHRIGDHLVFPVPEEEEVEFIKVSDYYDGIVETGRVYPIGRNQFGARFKYKHGIPEKLFLDNDLLEFFGYFVAEGNDNSSGIIISNTDKKIIQRIIDVGKNKFGFAPSIWKSKTVKGKTCVQVQFGSKILKKLFSSLFGSGCRNKRIPLFFLGLSEEKKKAFLKGLFKGDGCKEKSSEGYDILSYISTSKQLVYDLWLLLAKMGVIGAIDKNKEKNAHRLRIRGKQLEKLSNIFGRCKSGNRKTNRGFFIKGDKIFMGIRSLKKEFYRGKVYDIESAGSFVPFFAVHNCWLFPKGKGNANVGIGIGAHVGKSAAHYLDKWIAARPEISKGSIIEVNSGIIPVGGLLKKMTHDNLIVVGDAAHQVNPIHGGGIGLAMEAADMAAEIAEKAFKKNDFSNAALEEYNSVWWEKAGNKLKRILQIRHMMESLSDKDFEVLAQTLDGEDVMKIQSGSLTDSAKLVTKKLITKPGLLKLMLKYLKPQEGRK